MQKRLFLYLVIVCGLMVATIGCSKDDDDNSTPKTKTELLTGGTWKFSDVKVNGASVASFIDACQKDNILTFLTNGSGTAAEGASKCDPGDPDSNPFNWSFQTNETILFVSTPFFTGGSTTFTIVSLTESQLVLSQMVTLPGVPAQNAEVTFIH